APARSRGGSAARGTRPAGWRGRRSSPGVLRLSDGVDLPRVGVPRPAAGGGGLLLLRGRVFRQGRARYRQQGRGARGVVRQPLRFGCGSLEVELRNRGEQRLQVERRGVGPRRADEDLGPYRGDESLALAGKIRGVV